MHSTFSVIWTILERVRGFLDDTGGKYSDDYILQHKVMPEFVNVWSRMAQMTSNPLLFTMRINLVDGEPYYILPPNVQEVWDLRQFNTDGTLKRDWKPRGHYNGAQEGWRVEGNMLTIVPADLLGTASGDLEWDLTYMPNGDFYVHYATDGEVGEATSSSSSDDAVGQESSFILSNAPTVGLVDRRPNAYVGGMLRILNPATGNQVVEERIIESYDPVTREVEVRVPFSYYGDEGAPGTGTDITYEIVPAGFQSMAQAVAAAASRSLGVDKNISQKQMAFLDREYRMALKTVLDNVTNMQQRVPKHYDKKTVDNSERGLWWFGGAYR